MIDLLTILEFEGNWLLFKKMYGEGQTISFVYFQARQCLFNEKEFVFAAGFHP